MSEIDSIVKKLYMMSSAQNVMMIGSGHGKRYVVGGTSLSTHCILVLEASSPKSKSKSKVYGAIEYVLHHNFCEVKSLKMYPKQKEKGFGTIFLSAQCLKQRKEDCLKFFWKALKKAFPSICR